MKYACELPLGVWIESLIIKGGHSCEIVITVALIIDAKIKWFMAKLYSKYLASQNLQVPNRSNNSVWFTWISVFKKFGDKKYERM